MDSTALTILGVIILIICIVPFVAMRRGRKRREEMFIKSLGFLADKSNCKISEYEIWNKRAIGIDNDAHRLFFIKKTENSLIEKAINLPEIEKCRVVKTQRTVRNAKESHDVLDKLELIFDFRDKGNSALILEFYNTNEDSLTPADELQVSKKWAEISNSSIDRAHRSQI